MIEKVYDSGQTFEQMRHDMETKEPHSWDITTTMTLSEILWPDFHKEMMKKAKEFQEGVKNLRAELGNELLRALRESKKI